jgi:copper resistance protein C
MRGLKLPWVALILLYFTGWAQAHAILLTASPASGQVVHGPDIQVDLRFNSRIDAARSTITLVFQSGKLQTLPMNAPSSPDRLESSLRGLDSGSYVLRWQVLAIDGHISRGEVPFRVE